MNDFDVDAVMVKNAFFPQRGEFSVNSNPKLDTVEMFIDWAAADLEAALKEEEVTADEITDDDSSAFKWCQRTLCQMVAIRTMEAMAQQDTKLLEQWRRDVANRLKKLEERGAEMLGLGVTVPTQATGGPYTHIDSMGLEVSDPALASSSSVRLRRDDKL